MLFQAFKNHRIMELLRLEKTLKIIKSNHNLTILLTLNPLLSQVPERHIQMGLKHVQRWTKQVK